MVFFSLLLAGMHYNENGGRATYTTEEGKEISTLHFPKFKGGGYIVRRVTVAPTYGRQNYQLKEEQYLHKSYKKEVITMPNLFNFNFFICT